MINLNKDYRTKNGKRVRGLQVKRADEKAQIGKQIRNTGRQIPIIVGQVFMVDDLTEQNGWCTVVWDEDGNEAFGREDLKLVPASEFKVENKQTLLFN